MSERWWQYTTPEVIEGTSITYRALDNWVRHGWVTPSTQEASGSGSHRTWSQRDRERLVALGRLADDLARWGFNLAGSHTPPYETAPRGGVLLEWLWQRLADSETVTIDEHSFTIRIHCPKEH